MRRCDEDFQDGEVDGKPNIGTYLLVDECYIHGIMDEEAFRGEQSKIF